MAASILGLLFFTHQNIHLTLQADWLPYSILVGILFITLFFLIGNSSQKAGIAVTSLANKLSLVFPVFFSIVYFREDITLLKTTGLFTAFIAISLTVYKKELKKTNLIFVVLPLLIFVGGGVTDSIVKLVQALKSTPEEAGLFSTYVFIVAFAIALIISLLKNKNKINSLYAPTLILGITLGIVNFGSLYFIINALNFSKINSSLVFTLNNMCIVALSAISGYLLFHEKLSKLNVAGLLLAIVSLYFLV